MTGSAVQRHDVLDHIDNSTDVSIDLSLADEIYRLLFGTSPDLLDEILSHPLSIDYFNVYLSLPIFGQRVFCHPRTHQLDFDPPLATHDQVDELAKKWLMQCRLDHYIHTDIYIESLLSSLLVKTFAMSNFSSKETTIEKDSLVFSTVIDVREFYRFLRTTSGITYWNFFLDSLRLLKSRHSSRSNRIDISHLNFISKYSSQQRQLHSITNHLNKSRIPDSNTSDTVWLQMSIKAMHQLRLYWLPRYLSQLKKSPRSKMHPPSVRVTSNPVGIASLQDAPRASSSHLFHTSSTNEEPDLIPVTIANMSYLDYNPREYQLIQPTVQHDFQDEFPQSNDKPNPLEEACPIKLQPSIFPTVFRSIQDFATDDNRELFYRIFVSDALAGSPFLEYLTQSMIRTESVPCQTCIRLIADAEILLSIPFGRFKERILKQFISRYLEQTTTEELPSHLSDTIEEQRLALIEELMTENNEFPLLWKILLDITQFLTPHFLNYIKFDRLRFLVQGNPITAKPVFDNLHHRFPLINFESLLINQRQAGDTDLHTVESASKSGWIACGRQWNDPLDIFLQNQFNTTEKLINTDEQCEFRPGERFPPLPDQELQQELRQFCSQFGWKDVETVLGKSFVASRMTHPTDITTFIGDPKRKQTVPTVEYSPLNSIDRFTNEVMNTAREIFEVDRFVSDLMDESLDKWHENESLASIKTDLNSSPASEDILLTNSSEMTTSYGYVNQNAQTSSSTEIGATEEQDSRGFNRSSDRKVLSSMGWYFINASTEDVFDSILQKSINEFSLYQHIDSRSPSFHGSIKELTIDSRGIGCISVDLTKTNTSFNDETILQHSKKLKLYKDQHRECLLADVKSYTFDSHKQELYLYIDHFKLPVTTEPTTINSPKDLTIKFAQKDKSIEAKTTVIEKRTCYLSADDQEQLMQFIRNHPEHHQWPLDEYIGRKGQRAWRALKLAVDISSLDDQLVLDYHRDFDWISSDDSCGSFSERTHVIVRNYQRRIERQTTFSRSD